MSPYLSSAAVLIGALRVKILLIKKKIQVCVMNMTNISSRQVKDYDLALSNVHVAKR